MFSGRHCGPGLKSVFDFWGVEELFFVRGYRRLPTIKDFIINIVSRVKVDANGRPHSQSSGIHLAIVIREPPSSREKLLAVALVGQVRSGLLEHDVVEREIVAKLIHEGKLVDDARLVSKLLHGHLVKL